MRVCISTRVSTTRQDTLNQSLALTEWASQRDLKVVKVYEEEESAWKAGHQKMLAQLIEDARTNRFDAVLVWALDRLSREGALAILSLVNRLKIHGVKVISYQESWTEAPGELAEILYAIAGYWLLYCPEVEAASVVKVAIDLVHRAISSRTGSSGHAKSFLSQGFNSYWMFLAAVTGYTSNPA